MNVLFVLACFAFGLLMGSFLNVVAIRLLNKQSLSYPPSHCVHCRMPIKKYDLIPLISYLILGGRCRSCRKRISPRYFWGELACGVLFGLLAIVIGYQPELLAGFLLISILHIIVQTDIQAMIIPNPVIYFGIIGGVIIRIICPIDSVWSHLLGGIVGFSVTLMIAWVAQLLLKKEGLGGGDIKLFAFVGLMVGVQGVLLTFVTASFLGLVYSVIAIWSKKIDRHAVIPFGPFIAAGTLLVYLWGNSVWQWYLSLFL